MLSSSGSLSDSASTIVVHRCLHLAVFKMGVVMRDVPEYASGRLVASVAVHVLLLLCILLHCGALLRYAHRSCHPGTRLL